MADQFEINERAYKALREFILQDPAMQGQNFIDTHRSCEYHPDRIAHWLVVKGQPVKIFEKPIKE